MALRRAWDSDQIAAVRLPQTYAEKAIQLENAHTKGITRLGKTNGNSLGVK
jgi:hypothetical protein